jgi:hypothetical protein
MAATATAANTNTTTNHCARVSAHLPLLSPSRVGHRRVTLALGGWLLRHGQSALGLALALTLGLAPGFALDLALDLDLNLERGSSCIDCAASVPLTPMALLPTPASYLLPPTSYLLPPPCLPVASQLPPSCLLHLFYFARLRLHLRLRVLDRGGSRSNQGGDGANDAQAGLPSRPPALLHSRLNSQLSTLSTLSSKLEASA